MLIRSMKTMYAVYEADDRRNMFKDMKDATINMGEKNKENIKHVRIPTH